MRRLLLCFALLVLCSCEKDRWEGTWAYIGIDVTTDIDEAPIGEVAIWKLKEGHEVESWEDLFMDPSEDNWWIIYYKNTEMPDSADDTNKLSQYEGYSRSVFSSTDIRAEAPARYFIVVKLWIEEEYIYTAKEIYVTDDMNYIDIKVSLTDFTPERKLVLDGDWTIDYR